jgi:pyruvate/2-oxoglutarate dehydrogenase complex dihydrolipoamide acyltransferase (E2) component
MPRLPVSLPELGTSPVRFGLWLVEPGEAVYAGDRLAEVLIAGASVDVPSPVTGRLVERLAWPRDVLVPGQVLGFVESEEDLP